MGWFDEQIKQRKQKDDEVFSESFVHLAGSVMGEKIQAALNDDRQLAKDALEEILKYYHVKGREIPEGMEEIHEQMEYLLRPHGIMYRTVLLSEGWRRDAVGAMLGTRKADGSIVALIPNKIQGYRYLDRETGKTVAVSRKTEAFIETEAVCFYKPFPLKKISFGALFRFIFGTLSVWDVILFGFAVISVTLLGMLTPKLNNIIFSDIIASGSLRLVIAMTIFMICVSFSTILINGVKELLMSRIQTKMNMAVEAAAMMRVFSLPPAFFKTSSAGELSSRTNYISSLCNTLVSAVFGAGLSSVFSLAYFSQIFTYTPSLAVPAMGIIFSTTLFSAVSAFVQIGISRKRMELSAKESSMGYAMISGIQKIRLSGAEKRAFARWARLYAKSVRFQYNPPVLLKLNTVISMAITLIGNIILNYAAVKNGVTVADYYAFHVTYGMVSGAFMSLA